MVRGREASAGRLSMRETDPRILTQVQKTLRRHYS